MHLKAKYYSIEAYDKSMRKLPSKHQKKELTEALGVNASIHKAR
jgi:hypothetical protein